MKIKSIFVQNYKVLQNFKIDFCFEDNINPVTILTGINGSGKTSLLDFIFETFKKQSLTGNNRESYIEIIREAFDEKGRPTSLPSFSDKLTHESFKKDKNHYQSFKLSDKIIYYKANESNASAKKIITDYIDELIYEKNVKSSNAYEKIRKTLNEVLSTLNLEVEFGNLDKKKEIFFKNKYSDKIKLNDLSGGEKELITKVFPLFISDIKNSIILIDEPESSLHPNWQNEIVALYQKIAEKNNNQIIISTHSPHIVSALENKYIKILVKDKGKIKVEDVTSQSYGKKIDEILLDIFRINGLRTPVIEQKITRLRGMLSENQIDSKAFSDLLEDLEKTIGKYDEDLAQIRLEKLKIKKENEKNN